VVVLALGYAAFALMHVMNRLVAFRPAVDHLRKISSEVNSAAKNMTPVPSQKARRLRRLDYSVIRLLAIL